MTEVRQTRLHQLIAVAQGVRSTATAALTHTYRDLFQKRSGDFAGFSKTYTPKDDDSEQLPPENKVVQLRVEELFERMRADTQKFFDAAAAIENTNCLARASVFIDGSEFMRDVPVSVLLFLEKRLTDLHTLVSDAPVLDSDKQWSKTPDPNTGLFTTDPITTNRNVDTFRSFRIAPATDKHAEQAQLHKVPVFVGTFTTIHQSGALSPVRKAAILRKIRQLQAAVTEAREAANGQEIVQFPIHETVMSFVFSE